MKTLIPSLFLHSGVTILATQHGVVLQADGQEIRVERADVLEVIAFMREAQGIFP